jgi:sodium transport system permease protein
MRWSIIRLICLRDLRDQLRDRRTVVMIALLPLLLYPVLGMAVMRFAVGFATKPSTIGIVGKGPDFPPRHAQQGTPAGYPLLIRGGELAPQYVVLPAAVTGDKALPVQGLIKIQFLEDDGQAALEEKSVDLLLSAPDEFWSGVVHNVQPALHIQARADDSSGQAYNRLILALEGWKKDLTRTRLRVHGLPDNYDDPFQIRDDRPAAGGATPGGPGIFGQLGKIFPFMLVMWALAGALYPAVDLCAGEKERGTMETLIISPASREEIVLGKFLTIWIFSAGTSLLNLASMGLTGWWQFSSRLPGAALQPMGLLWSVALLVPVSAFFSAVCLAVGAYARSSKEGQYYLMPLFLITMPLIFLTLAPGVELSPFYSLVPVTGAALLMQQLMSAGGMEPTTLIYFLPVLGPLVLYSWLALRWAIAQFKREEVLFREAERLDIGLWLRRLFREKEALPSAGQAFFCFALIMGLRWLSLGLGQHLQPLVPAAIRQLAFTGAPAVFMALVLTTRPRLGLGLKPASPGALGIAFLLAAVAIEPLVQLTQQVYEQLDVIKEMVDEHKMLVGVLQDNKCGAVLVFAVLPSVCEELAFRGFILSGLRRRFTPWNAIWLSSFMFALYPMNVFQFLPTFLLGAILGLLTVRSGSIWPAVLFHLLHNGLLVVSTWLTDLAGETTISLESMVFLRFLITILCALLAGLLLWRLVRAAPLPTPEDQK